MPAISMRTGGYFEGLHGRLHCGNFAVFVYLSDVDVGDGGLLVVRSTTALCNRSTDSTQATIVACVSGPCHCR